MWSKELLPEDALGLGDGVEIERDFDKALKQAGSGGAAVAMMLRIQRERLVGWSSIWGIIFRGISCIGNGWRLVRRMLS